MHAVGDRGDRHLGGVEGAPQALEHLPGHLTVQQRDAVGALAEPEAHHRHVELARDRRPRSPPPRGPAPGPAAARRSRRTGRRSGRRGNRSMPAGTGVWVVKTVPARFRSSAVVEVQALRHELPDPLQAEEAGVALVGVEDLRARALPVIAQYARIARTPPMPSSTSWASRWSRAAAVQPVGRLPLRSRRSARRRSPSAAAAPGRPGPPRPGRAGVRPASGTSIRTGPSSSCSRVSGSAVRVEQRIALLLPAGRVQRLPEVALR